MVLPFVSLVQSVDSLHLLEAISAWAVANQRTVDVLLELHLGAEETKQGFTEEEILAIVSRAPLTHVRIRGLMGMATNTPNRDLVRQEFRTLHSYRDQLAEKYFVGHPEFKEISMGMSHDYDIAMEEGSTLIRVGTSIFGARDYGVPVND
jgi:uncharacterized pyridoxal phosphate-containing UPF0001 family protein